MEARIIGPEAELGDARTLQFFDNTLTREFSEINVTPDQLEKLKGNRFVEVKGAEKPENVDEAAALKAKQEADEAASIRGRLAELGVATDGRSSLPSLKSKLEAAEKAEAKERAGDGEPGQPAS